MSSQISTLKKFPKLGKDADYLQWKRRIYGFIRREEPFLEYFSQKLTEEAKVSAWEEKSAKEKSTIILFLYDVVLAKTRSIVDDDGKSAKELWDEMKRMYTTYTQQAMTNLHNRLNSCSYDELSLWENHLSLFTWIIEELASFDQELLEEEKVASLTRYLPYSFDPLDIVSSMMNMYFDRLISSEFA